MDSRNVTILVILLLVVVIISQLFIITTVIFYYSLVLLLFAVYLFCLFIFSICCPVCVLCIVYCVLYWGFRPVGGRALPRLPVGDPERVAVFSSSSLLLLFLLLPPLPRPRGRVLGGQQLRLHLLRQAVGLLEHTVGTAQEM